MTVKKPYTVLMNVLLSKSGLGVIWLAVLFVLCFALVHIARLVRFGRAYQKQQKQTQPPEEKTEKPTEKKTPPQNAGEPVYYIVERKRRTKSSFGEPKRIDFK